ncbi:hypothetical protein HanPSC8_Chr07g0291421 [Helianthus annuus]|nr:hypothetical protein HanIR_Chr07g0324691 [Helianthus annuus]KAJ0905216.1 hypothetical protein HanPSC8_Chr07g0291421 [Helianthus annuus]
MNAQPLVLVETFVVLVVVACSDLLVAASSHLEDTELYLRLRISNGSKVHKVPLKLGLMSAIIKPFQDTKFWGPCVCLFDERL